MSKTKKKQNTAPDFFDIRFTSQKRWIVIAIISIFAFILYGNTIGNLYSFDDVYVTNNDEARQGFSAIPKLFTSFYANMFEDGKPLKFGYRPIVKTTFALEYGLWGENPHLSHFINILLYLSTSILLFFLLRKLIPKAHFLFHLFVVLVFMAHPSHTEVVASLKNRDELLGFLGAIATLWYFVKYFESNKLIYIPVALIIYSLAYLSKPTVLIFVFVYPLALYFFTDSKIWKLILIAALVFAVAWLSKSIPRMFIEGSSRPILYVENPMVFDANFTERVATSFYVLWFYIKMTVLPHPLCFYYGFNTIPITNFANIFVILSILIHITLFIYSLINIRKKQLLAFAFLYYLLTIAIFSNILKPAMGIVADRFLYYPSLGFSISIVLFFFKLLKSNPLTSESTYRFPKQIFVLIIPLLLIYSAKTIDRNKDWKTQLSLMEADIGHLENSAKANFIYAGTLKAMIFNSFVKGESLEANRTKLEKFLKHINLTIKIYPDYYQAYDMKGQTMMILFKEYKKAEKEFRKSIELKPDFFPAKYNLGFSLWKQGKIQEAISILEQTAEEDKNSIKAFELLIRIYSDTGNTNNIEVLKEQIDLRNKILKEKNIKNED